MQYMNFSTVFCTCSEAFSLRVVDNIEPTHLIIDEAAMATEPEAMIPIKSTTRVTLIGDHMQLQVCNWITSYHKNSFSRLSQILQILEIS